MSEEKNKNDYEIEDEFDDSEEFSFWSFRTIFTLFLMVLLIGAGIYSFNREPEESIDEKVADLEEKKEETKSEEEKKSEESKTEEAKSEESKEEDTKAEDKSSEDVKEIKTEESKEETESVEEVKSTGEKVSVVTQSGEGVTHLARKAIANYIESNNIELSVEQKLFAETHIKDLYKSKYKGLNKGDTVEFDSADITNTVSKAKDLSQGQIKAWNKYVKSVPSLK